MEVTLLVSISRSWLTFIVVFYPDSLPVFKCGILNKIHIKVNIGCVPSFYSQIKTYTSKYKLQKKAQTLENMEFMYNTSLWEAQAILSSLTRSESLDWVYNGGL